MAYLLLHGLRQRYSIPQLAAATVVCALLTAVLCIKCLLPPPYRAPRQSAVSCRRDYDSAPTIHLLTSQRRAGGQVTPDIPPQEAAARGVPL